MDQFPRGGFRLYGVDYELDQAEISVRLLAPNA